MASELPAYGSAPTLAFSKPFESGKNPIEESPSLPPLDNKVLTTQTPGSPKSLKGRVEQHPKVRYMLVRDATPENKLGYGTYFLPDGYEFERIVDLPDDSEHVAFPGGKPSV